MRRPGSSTTGAKAAFLLALQHEQSGRLDDAVAGYRRSIVLGDTRAIVYNNLGNILQRQRQLVEAIECYQKAIASEPLLADTYNNLGPILGEIGSVDLAENCYRQAILLRPGFAEANANLGMLLHKQNRLDDAVGFYRTALEGKPDFAEVHYNLALLLLKQGNWAAGWPEYEWRWKTALSLAPHRRFAQPQWRGEAAAGRTLFVHIEQGLGDMLQFCRYVPLIAARGLSVILEVQKPLGRLLRDVQGVSRILVCGDALPAFDLHCPIHSLPLAFGTSLTTIPSPDQYLHADADLAAEWDRRLRAMPDQGKRVGLVWAGNRAHADDSRRSIAPERLAPFAQMPGLNFFSVQKDARAAPFPLIDLMGEMTDFADTAALVANLDLVITVDTAVAHLGAALGKPVWLLDRFESDWRWLTGRRDSPWYSTLRIYRQPSPGDWDSVIADVARDLKDLAAR